VAGRDRRLVRRRTIWIAGRRFANRDRMLDHDAPRSSSRPSRNVRATAE
jgi:hypothetical protein